jgi:HK97 gp10 family phage protein
MANQSIDIASFSADAKRLVQRLEFIVKDLRKEKQEIFKKAAVPLIMEIQSRAPKSEKPHSRYSGGKIVATYYPGNLSRSFAKTLIFRSSSAVWVAPKVGKGAQGEFKGSRADGYYAHMVEYGTKFQSPQPFVRPSVDSAGPKVYRIAIGLIQIKLRKYNGTTS